MSNPLADEARALNDDQLAEAVNEAYRELFNLQFQKGTRQLQDGTAIPRTRRQIARLRTLQRERQIAVVPGTPIAPVAVPEEAAISPQKQRALDERAGQEIAEAAELEKAQAEDGVAPSLAENNNDVGDDIGDEPDNEEVADAAGDVPTEDPSDDDGKEAE